MRLPLLLLALPAALAAQSASIEGSVVNRAGGQALSGVHVSLLAVETAAVGDVERAYGAVTDQAGHFSIADLKPGMYEVQLARTGFRQARTGSAPAELVTLKAGQNLTGYKLEMNARAIILGRVLDDYGDPVQGIQVQALIVPPDLSQDRMPFERAIATTDDRGEFRILTSPGRYYVLASPPPPDDAALPEIRTDGSVPAANQPTYYPNAAATRSASIVQAGAGQDVTGIEIHLRQSAPAGSLLTVSGQVTGAPAGAQSNVTLRIGRSPDRLWDAHATETTPDGKFFFSGLQAASYSVFARYSSGKTGLQSQSVDFQLDSSDRSDIQLNLVPGEELTGTVEFVGDATPAVSPGQRTVSLTLVDAYYNGKETPAADTIRSGAFRFTNIHPGKYRVNVAPLPENAYLQPVVMDEALAPDFTLDFSRGVHGAKLKIAVNLKGAQISGKVAGHDGEPLLSPAGTVMLWTETEELTKDQAQVVNSAYSLKALVPGKYRIAAIDNLEMADLARDWNELIRLLRMAAEPIEVTKGDRIVKDLKVIAKEDLHVKAKQ